MLPSPLPPLDRRDASSPNPRIECPGRQNPDLATDAYLHLQSEDLAKLKAYLGAKETKAAWKDAGVQGTPKVTVLKEGAMTMYTN